MFITMPIKSFKLEDNKVFINESVIEYEPISDDHKEILESLISKGAYGSALLTLNKFYSVKTINESKCTQKEYTDYITECNNLMKECVSETKAHNFRPLINLGGLEIMESATQIARGKGDTLLVEDFRKANMLKEQDIIMPSDNIDGWGEDIEDLTSEFFDFVDRVSYEIKNAQRGSYAEIGTSIEQLAQTFERIADWATELSETLNNAEINYTSDEDDLNEECEGTQCSDIAEKKDQEVGSLQKPKRIKKRFTEMFRVPKNHGFKGFRLNEQGRYVRGNYVLINENGSIKAVKANIIDDQGTHVWDYNQVNSEQAPRLVSDLNKHFNEDYDIYDFGFRIEDNQLKVYDANEEFDFSYLDDKYEQANKILQDLFGKGAYFEAELAPIGVVAGIEIKDLN